MQEPYDAIIFDLGGVVLNLDYNKTIDAFKVLGKKNFEQLYTQSQQDKIFDKFETGEITSAEFRNYMRAFIQEEIGDEKIDAAWNAMLLDLPSPRVALLKELRKNYTLFLYSNTNEIHFAAFQNIIETTYGDKNLLETIFHQTYYSHLINMRKPNTNGFQKILADNNLIAARTLFIDDSAQHIEGAKQLNLQTFHLVDKDILQLFNFNG